MASTVSRVSDAVKQDHRELEDYYNKIMKSSSGDEKTRYQNQFIWELARHSVGEELVVYPSMEKHLENGKAMADKDRQEHAVVKELLAKFQKLNHTSPEFESTLESIWTDLSKHIQDEEKQDLPMLESALTEAESERLNKSFYRTKMFAPTRSHPHAPDKPPFETVAGLLAAPIDHLRDMFNKFPTEK